jgi:hypothetical protein
VRGLLSSPRRRRRLATAGATVAVVGTLLAGVVALADSTTHAPERLRPGPPETVLKEVPLTSAMRRGIDRTLAEFVPAAVARRNPARAWQLAGPGLRAGGSLRGWKSGELPVHPYAYATSRSLRDWTTVYARRDRVAIDLMLYPRAGSPQGPIAFGIDLVPRGRAWVVDSIFPAAIWTGKKERAFVTGMQDFTGKFGSKKSTYDKPDLPESRLAAAWIAVPGLLLGACLLAPLVLGVRSLLNRRRRPPPEPLPPLPSTLGR